MHRIQLYSCNFRLVKVVKYIIHNCQIEWCIFIMLFFHICTYAYMQIIMHYRASVSARPSVSPHVLPLQPSTRSHLILKESLLMTREPPNYNIAPKIPFHNLIMNTTDSVFPFHELSSCFPLPTFLLINLFLIGANVCCHLSSEFSPQKLLVHTSFLRLTALFFYLSLEI